MPISLTFYDAEDGCTITLLLRVTEAFNQCCKNPFHELHGIANKLSDLIFLVLKVTVMAAMKSSGKRGQKLLAALNSMGGNGLSVPSEDLYQFEALIDDYFDDDSRSEFGSEWGGRSGKFLALFHYMVHLVQ